MTWWEAVLLGLIQGLTEFLPVSSSGHLVLGQYLLDLSESGITFEVFVHFGTVLSILTVYRQRVRELVRETFAALSRPASWTERYRTGEDFRLIVFILITMVPTGVVYVLFGDALEAAFNDPRLVCGMLLVTGTLLLLTVLRKDPNGPITPLRAFLIGCAQSAAMTPGISRSGATICAALYQNVTPQKAADFSFLMLLPVVIGATLLKTIELLQQAVSPDWGALTLGTLVAYGSGIVAIKVVIDVVRRGKLQYFAYYCYAVGLFGLYIL